MVDFLQHGVDLVEWLDQSLMKLGGIRRKSCRRKSGCGCKPRICKIWCENIPTVLIFHNGEVVGKQVG
jgi:hypothetical protein